MLEEKMEKQLSEEQIQKAIDLNKDEAETLLQDADKMERFLQRLEQKLKNIPKIGDKLADVPILVSLVRSYVKKEYTDLPIGTIIGIVAVLIYFVNPFDIIPDSVPVIGYFDDVAVVAFAIKMAHDDVEEYKKWKEENGKKIL